MEEDFTPAEGLEEAEVEEIPEDTEEEAFEMNETGEDGGIPVKVLKPNGDTSTYVPEYDEEISALDKGIENAKQPYLDEAKEIADEYNRIIEDSEMENEDKISSLEMEKNRLTSLKDQWQEESSEWYEEKDRLQKMKSQQTIDDMQENESVDISSDELNSFSDKIKNFWEDDTEDNAYVSDNTNKIHDINNQAKDIRSPKSIEGMDANEPNVDVFPLEKTNQTINNIELDDGSEQKIFDHPDRLLNELPYSQGINEFDKEGTCALANLGSWLEIGGSRNVENDIVKYEFIPEIKLREIEIMIEEIEVLLGKENDKFQEAIEFYEKKFKIQNTTYGRCFSKYYLAFAYEELNNFDKMKESLEFVAENGNVLHIAETARDILKNYSNFT